MPSTISHGQASSDQSKAIRLDGWKEIASYLRRGERTVKRWEAEWQLPIHRVPSGTHGRVYARTAELDEWLASKAAEELASAVEDIESEQNAADCALNSIGAVSAPSAGFFPSAPPQLAVRHLMRWALAASAVLMVAIAAYGVFRLHARTFRDDPAQATSAEHRSAVVSVVTAEERRIAHDLCLRGRFEWSCRTPEDLRRALDDFTQALVHNPGSVEAYAGLADTYILLREYSNLPEKDAYAQALVAARKAVSLDESSAEGHRALAFVLTNGNWDFINGEKEFRRAIDLNPSDPVARRWYANAFAIPGNMNKALEQMDKAQELDPTSKATIADKGLLLYKAGRIAEGVDLLKQVERTDPEFRSPHFYLMSISFAQRNYSAYLVEARKTAEAESDKMLLDITTVASEAYRRGGTITFLEALYGSQKKYYEEGRLPGMMFAKTCIAMGNRKEALEILEQEYKRHSPVFLWCLSDPDLLTLKSEPQYVKVVKNISLPWLLKDAHPGPNHNADPSPMSAVNDAPR